MPIVQVSDTFVVYLAAFLIHFDAEFRMWWTRELKYQMPFGIRPKYRCVGFVGRNARGM